MIRAAGARALAAALVAAWAAVPASAIDPDRAPSQYMRERWGAERGFPGGAVYGFAQTPDGFLWIGTANGLVRFDGTTFRVVGDGGAGTSPTPVLGLQSDADGGLWLRVWGPTALLYRGGRFVNLSTELGWRETAFSAMCRAADGSIVLSAMDAGTVSYRAGQLETLAPPGALPRSPVIAMTQSPAGDVWLGTRDAGLFRLSADGGMTAIAGVPDLKVNCLLPSPDGTVWVGTDDGVARLGPDGAPGAAPPPLGSVQALAMASDRDGNVWVGTDARGLLRCSSRGVTALDGPSEGAVTAIFEDREGSLWIGRGNAIERIRDSAFTTYASAEGLPSDASGPVYVDARDRTWFAPTGGGLYRMADGRVEPVGAAGLGGDVVYSITGVGDDVWIGRQRGGLTHLRTTERGVAATTYTRADGLAQNSVYAVARSLDGAVWAGTLSAGVSRLLDGVFTTFTTRDGLASNTVNAVAESGDGTMWFATPAGLTSFANGVWRTYTLRDGLPSNAVDCLLVDSTGAVWVGTSAGVARMRGGLVETPPDLPSALHEPVVGMAEDDLGQLWLATSSRVLRVARERLAAGPIGDEDVRQYGFADGLRSVEGVKRQRSVVADPHGRVWVSTTRGLSVVDPARLASRATPSLAHVESVTADGGAVDLGESVRIAPSTQRVSFAFVGLGLAVPDRVRYRYRLEGFDRDWSAPTSTHEAVYTNLAPGSYRFRVIASDADGRWSGDEAAIDVVVEPAVWQTLWFRLAMTALAAVVLLGLYGLRLRQLTRRLNERFDERLAERTRIARDLHDTLLQGLLSASMQLQVADERLAPDSPAKPLVGRVVSLMSSVIDDGRRAVNGLRSSADEGTFELERAFSLVPHELDADERVELHVFVEGRVQKVHPVIRDEVYWIGREAIANAFRHAGADRIDVTVRYAPAGLGVVVRDDGRGIDADTIRSGRDGHWGLTGMRERAEKIGARLAVHSGSGAGTEVRLSVPAYAAFPDRPVSRARTALSRLFGRGARAAASVPQEEQDS